MNRYTVVYLSEAEDDLATIWEDAVDRHRVTESADRAEQILAASPQRHSVYLKEELRRLEILPLRFYFSILEPDRVVEVGNVIRIQERG